MTHSKLQLTSGRWKLSRSSHALGGWLPLSATWLIPFAPSPLQRLGWFACARLSDSQLIPSGGTFSLTLTTMAFDQRSVRCFEACSCKPIPRGLPSSSMQPRGALYPINRQKLEVKKNLWYHPPQFLGLNCWFLLLCCEFSYPTEIIGFIEEFAESSY